MRVKDLCNQVLVEDINPKTLSLRLKELEETLGALKQHLERFTEREEELLATYNQLKQMLAESEGA